VESFCTAGRRSASPAYIGQAKLIIASAAATIAAWTAATTTGAAATAAFRHCERLAFQFFELLLLIGRENREHLGVIGLAEFFHFRPVGIAITAALEHFAHRCAKRFLVLLPDFGNLGFLGGADIKQLGDFVIKECRRASLLDVDFVQALDLVWQEDIGELGIGFLIAFGPLLFHFGLLFGGRRLKITPPAAALALLPGLLLLRHEVPLRGNGSQGAFVVVIATAPAAITATTRTSTTWWSTAAADHWILGSQFFIQLSDCGDLFVGQFKLLANFVHLEQSQAASAEAATAEHAKGRATSARRATAAAATTRLTLRLSHCYCRETQPGDDRQATEKLKPHGELLRCCLIAVFAEKANARLEKCRKRPPL
jgi:hypothetical protein